MPLQYKLVKAVSVTDFKKFVDAAISDDWKPFGGVSVVLMNNASESLRQTAEGSNPLDPEFKTDKRTAFIFWQAMIKGN